MNLARPLLFLTLALVLPAGTAHAAEWTLLADKSAVRFEGTQSGQPFAGRFNRISGTVTFNPADPGGARIDVEIDLTSAVTGNAQIDGALPGSDWFDTGTSPTASYTANGFEDKGDGNYVANGTLAMKGVEVPVALPFRLTIEGDAAKAQGRTTLDRVAHGIGAGQFADPSVAGTEVVVIVDVTAARAAR